MTPKQAAFVREYLIDLNGKEAAIRAGYSAKTAKELAYKLMHSPAVLAAIKKTMDERARRVKVDADWVLRRLHDEATADIAQLYDDAGNLLPVKQWPMVFRQGLVVGVDIEDDQGVKVRKIKMLDRTKTIELLGKHVGVGAFKERIEVEDVTDRAEQMRQARAKRLGGGA